MSNYNASDSLVQERQLKVQRLVIPFVITGNATPASVVPSNDEPGFMFIRTEGVNQITPALSSGEASPTITAPNDAAGQFAIMLVINEQINKVMCAQVVRRNALASDPADLANTTGITANGDKIILNVDSSVNLSSASLDACLMVEYIVQ